MKKRALCWLLALVMILSLVPFAALAEGEIATQAVDEDKEVLTPGEMTTDSMVTNKYLTESGSGYDLTMTAYATGGTMTQELESDVPLDIVLVIDQSGSMLTPDMASSTGYESSTKDWTVDQAVGWYYKVGSNYYEIKAEKGSLRNEYYHPTLSDALMGVSGESLHTSWNSWATPYLVQDSSGNLVTLYVRTQGYLGGYDAQFYYYNTGSSSATFIPFNSASGSTTASYSRGGIGTGSMDSNSNRLWTTVYSSSTSNGNNRLYYLDGSNQKVYISNAVTYSSQTALSNTTLYYKTTSNMTRLDALRQAAGQFVQSIGDRAAQTGTDHRVAVVGFAGNEIPSTSVYTDNGTTVDIPYSHILGNSTYITQNTGLFVNKSFKNYITPNLWEGNTGIGTAIPKSTQLYTNITYFYKYNTTYFPLNYDSDNSRYYDTYTASDGTLGSDWVSGNSSGSNIVSNHYPVSNNLVYYPAVTELGQADYQAALVKVNQNDTNTNNVNDDLDWAVSHVDAYGGTYLSYGMAMANNVFKHNTNVVDGVERKRIVVVFTDGQPGRSGFEDAIANEAKAAASIAKDTYGATVYTVGLYPTSLGPQVENFMHELSSEYFTTTSEVTGQSINSSNSTYYFNDANGLPHSVKRDANSQWTRPKWTNTPVGNRTIPVTSNNGTRTQAVWVDSNGWLRGAKWNAQDNRNGPDDNIWQFYSVGESTATNKGTFYYPASSASELAQVFQSISESIQTPYTTVSLNGENSALKDTITKEFTVNTNKTQNPVTFSLEKGTVSSEGAAPAFVPVTNPSSAERAILNGISYTWTTNSDGSNTLNVTGFDYSANYVAYQHPGYKLIATVHGLTTDSLGKLYSNTSMSGVYKDDALVAPLPMPYVTKEAAPQTYVIDFNGKMKIAEDATFQIAVNEHLGENGIFVKSGNADAAGTITYQLTSDTQTAAQGTTIEINQAYSSADTATIYGKFYTTAWQAGTEGAAPASVSTRDDTASWKNVTVIPASSIYFDDDLGNADAAAVTVGDGSGYNADIDASSPDAVNTQPGVYNFTFTGTGIDVYCTTYDKDSANNTAGYAQATILQGNQIVTVNNEKQVQTMRNQSNTTRYNVPTFSFHDLPQGTYTLKLTILSSSNYKLDGIRVYNPVADQSLYADNGAAQEQYATFINLREALVNDKTTYNATVPSTDDAQHESTHAVLGALFVDDSSKLVRPKRMTVEEALDAGYTQDQIIYVDADNNVVPAGTEGAFTAVNAYADEFAAYKGNSPKHEIYLENKDNNQQAIVFTLTPAGVTAAQNGDLWIGLSAPDKSANGGTVTLKDAQGDQPAKTIDVKNAVDMYYPISKDMITVNTDGTGTVMIKNTGSSMISVTNLKITGNKTIYTTANPSAATPESVDGAVAESVADVLPLVFEPMTMHAVKIAANGGVDPDAQVVEPDDPGTPDTPDEPVEPDKPIWSDPMNFLKTLFDLLLKSLSNLFSGLGGW